MKEEAFDNLVNDMWDELNLKCGGYNSEIDADIIQNLKDSLDNKPAFAHEKYTELIKYILCSNDLMEYGTSPRFAWTTEKGKEFYKKYAGILEGF